MAQILQINEDLYNYGFYGIEIDTSEQTQIDIYKYIEGGVDGYDDNLSIYERGYSGARYYGGFEDAKDPGIHTGHKVRWVWSRVDNSNVLSFAVYCDGEEIASWENLEAPISSETLVTKTLTENQATSITDYSKLEFRIFHKSGYWADIFAVEMEIPDPPTKGGPTLIMGDF